MEAGEVELSVLGHKCPFSDGLKAMLLIGDARFLQARRLVC